MGIFEMLNEELEFMTSEAKCGQILIISIK